MASHETFDSILHSNNIEIEQKTKVLATEAQICQALRLMNFANGFDCFDFNDHPILHKDVHTVSTIYFHILIKYRQSNFCLDGNIAYLKLMDKTCRICGFE